MSGEPGAVGPLTGDADAEGSRTKRAALARMRWTASGVLAGTLAALAGSAVLRLV